LGAVDFVTKTADRDRLPEFAASVIDKIKTAHAARVPRPVIAHNRGRLARRAAGPATAAKLIAIGASTGGTEAIKDILMELPDDGVPMVVVQHMPAGFTRAFADRLNGICPPRIKEAADGDRLERGCVLIAPGDFHMRLQRRGTDLAVRLDQTEPVNRHRPSVDVLFRSCREVAGASGIGVLLTGMGDDGARGLEEMRSAGAHTIAQDESTSVIFGMPKVAIERGAAEVVLPLGDIAEALLRWCSS
jgi:two-component system chemotaxis response regulator CheB